MILEQQTIFKSDGGIVTRKDNKNIALYSYFAVAPAHSSTMSRNQMEALILLLREALDAELSLDSPVKSPV